MNRVVIEVLFILAGLFLIWFQHMSVMYFPHPTRWLGGTYFVMGFLLGGFTIYEIWLT